MTTKIQKVTKRQLAEFRFSILGQLFSRPPAKGELAERLRELSEQAWLPPKGQYPVKYSVRTLERWYSAARNSSADPVSALLPAKRADAGIVRVLTDDHQSWLRNNFRIYPKWSWKLHADNLGATDYQPCPSYSTILRWMRSQGLFPVRSTSVRKNDREILSFESAFAGELWHFDGHAGSRKVLGNDGQYRETKCIAFIDDYSRLCCHCQWVDGESAEEVIHIFQQAILKRGLPRKVMSDNGSGMIAHEFEEGVKRLAIKHEKTMPRSPYQNGKIESFWKPMEGRLIAMLDNVKPLSLELLNKVTQAWVEQEYNQTIHSETKEKPTNRFFHGKDVLRASPQLEHLQRAFRMVVTRKQRRTDGTLTLDGVRFQVPERFRHIENLTIAYSRWNLRQASILDRETLKEIEDIFPVDKVKNSSMQRSFLPTVSTESIPNSEYINNNIPPLLQRLMQQHSQVSHLSGFIPLTKEI